MISRSTHHRSRLTMSSAQLRDSPVDGCLVLHHPALISERTHKKEDAMHRTQRRLTTAGLAAVAIITLTTDTVAAESNGGVRLMPLGDSITDGFNVSGGYRINLWQRLVASGRTVDLVGSAFNGPAELGDHDHEGHSGWLISQID